MASNLPETAAAQSPTKKRARSARPRAAALRAAVRTAPSAISTPTPIAAGNSARSASRRQPVPVPRSRRRSGRASIGSAASTASTRVSVSGRGSSVSADRANPGPRTRAVRGCGSAARASTIRAATARTPPVCCSSDARDPGGRTDRAARSREPRQPIGGPARRGSLEPGRRQRGRGLGNERAAGLRQPRFTPSPRPTCAAWSSARIASMISSSASPLITLSIL